MGDELSHRQVKVTHRQTDTQTQAMTIPVGQKASCKNYELTKDTQYFAITGELWGMLYSYLERNDCGSTVWIRRCHAKQNTLFRSICDQQTPSHCSVNSLSNRREHKAIYVLMLSKHFLEM